MPLLWLAYPLLVHAAVLTDEPLLEAAALGLLLGLILLAPLSRRRLWAALTLAGGLLAAAAFAYSGWGIYFLYLPPVLLNAFLCALFAQSLGAARTPIISAVARSIRGAELPPTLQRYTRQLTLFWALLFAAMGTVSALLALLAPDELWSAFTNFYSYLILALVFIIEFGMRRLLFRDDQHTSAKAYIRGLIKTDFRRL